MPKITCAVCGDDFNTCPCISTQPVEPASDWPDSQDLHAHNYDDFQPPREDWLVQTLGRSRSYVR